MNAIAYIATASLKNADLVAERILQCSNLLGEAPQIGRPGRIPGTRELPVRKTNYILIYRIDGDEVSVIRILHGHQDWPTE